LDTFSEHISGHNIWIDFGVYSMWFLEHISVHILCNFEFWFCATLRALIRRFLCFNSKKNE
jgi:hypothetical protein